MEFFFAVSLEIVKLSNCQNVNKGHFEANYRVPVMEAMGAWGEKSMYGKKVMGTIRLGFIVS